MLLYFAVVFDVFLSLQDELYFHISFIVCLLPNFLKVFIHSDP